MPPAVVRRWYRTVPMDDGVTLIDEPFVKPFYRCNMWHLRGRDRDLLIDTGMGVVSLRESVPLLAERPLWTVASHSHYDHIGSLHEFEVRLAHPAEADILADPRPRRTLAAGHSADDFFTRLPPGGFEPDRYLIAPAPATDLLEDGDEIDLGDLRLQVVHTPGHSPGGIALYQPESGILFAGDIVYDGPLVENAYHSDADDYLRSMERLLELPVTVVHAGHYPSFGRARFRQIIRDWLAAKGRRPAPEHGRTASEES